MSVIHIKKGDRVFETNEINALVKLMSGCPLYGNISGKASEYIKYREKPHYEINMFFKPSEAFPLYAEIKLIIWVSKCVTIMPIFNGVPMAILFEDIQNKIVEWIENQIDIQYFSENLRKSLLWT